MSDDDWLDQQHAALTSGSIDEAARLVPRGWISGLIFWPGYDQGKYIDCAVVELHHALSSGGGPKVIAYGKTVAEALAKAAQMALEREREDATCSHEARGQ